MTKFEKSYHEVNEVKFYLFRFSYAVLNDKSNDSNSTSPIRKFTLIEVLQVEKLKNSVFRKELQIWEWKFFQFLCILQKLEFSRHNTWVNLGHLISQTDELKASFTFSEFEEYSLGRKKRSDYFKYSLKFIKLFSIKM